MLRISTTKKLLLDVLNYEDDYIEVSKLIKHFATLTQSVLYSYYLLVFLPSSFFVCECNLLYC